jgi:succinoglycan biosynthesis transport protein ExoP
LNQDSTITSTRSALLARFFSDLHRYRNLVTAWWWLLLLIALLAVGLRCVLFAITPPSFKSEGLMIVNVKLSLPTGNIYSEELNNFLGTQAALLQSDTVSNRALSRMQSDKPNLQPIPVKLHVTVSPKTSLFELRATGIAGPYVEAWLQTVMEEYINVKKELVQHTSKNTRTVFEESIMSIGRELQQAKEELVAYGSSNSVVFLQEQGNSAANRLEELTKQRDNLQADLRLLQMLTLDENVDLRQAMVQGGLIARPASRPEGTQSPASPVASPDVSPSTSGQKNGNMNQDETQSSLVGSETEYLKAKQHVAILEQQRKEMSVNLRPQHPKMIALQEEIDRQKSLLEIFRSQTQEQLASRQHALDLQIQGLDRQIEQCTASALVISKKMADYTAIKEKIQRLQSMYDNLLTSEHTVDMEKEINPESVTILQSATPAVVIPRDIIRQLLLAGLLGLLFGGLVLVVLRRLDDRPHSLIDVQDLFEETVLGQIPYVPEDDKRKGVPILRDDDDRHVLAEAFRNLRSSITLLSSEARQARTILVTSAIPKDGKSITASNLAIMLARSGARVLLVDADLRQGKIHRQFELPPTPGLAEILGEQLDWSRVVTQNSVPNLSIVPRGIAPRHTGELFTKPIKEKFLTEARAQYDFVLIDSPPVMAADDVSNLAPYADLVLMVIRANHTPGRVARAALDLLYLRKTKALGLVFNGATSSGDYYYYKYKEYYATSHPADS